MQEKEARLRAKMAAIRLKIERLEDRARKHEARHAELMSRSRELPLPLSAQTREKMVGAVQKTKGALQENRVTLQRAGEIIEEETTQLGEAVKGAGAKARGAMSGTPRAQETYTTYERTEETQDQTPPLPEPEGEGRAKIAEETSSRFSQGTPRKAEEPKIEELERQTEEP